MNKDFDDKALVILAVTIIALAAMWRLPDAENIITSVVSGLFGVAVGRALK